MIATNMCSNFVGNGPVPPVTRSLMRMVLEKLSWYIYMVSHWMAEFIPFIVKFSLKHTQNK